MGAPSVRDVADLLDRAARESPQRVALVETGVHLETRRVTWAELEDEVGRVATGLGGSGIVAGHRVMLVLGNRVEFVVGYLAVLRAQAVAVPVNPTSAAGELARMIADSGSRLVVADAETVVAVREAVRLLDEAQAVEHPAGSIAADLVARLVVPRVVVVGGTLQPGERSWDHLRADRARGVPPLLDPEKLAALLYTSGTSGRPRGAMLTHRALLANVEQLGGVEAARLGPDDVVLCVLPLFHVYGLNAVLGGVMRDHATLVLVPRFDPEGTLDLIEAERCTVVPIAPPVIAYWRGADRLRERLSSVRLVLSGSAPLAPEVGAEFEEHTGLTVHQGYGLTEASPVVTSTLCSVGGSEGGSTGGGARLQPGSVGAALPGIELRLVDETGRAPEGEDPGQIQLRGANLFSGYWPDASEGPGPEGWWSTGDVGFLDADGDLFLVDRLKELVIVSGFNVYPVEVEDAIREVPGVAEAAVIGVADEETGEAVVAYVVARDPGADRDALAGAVRAHCAARLARFKQPSRTEVVDALPVGVTGKVQKGRLRGMERRRALGLLE